MPIRDIHQNSDKKSFQEKFKSVVSSVHEVHLWSHVPDQIVATLHVKFRAKEVSALTIKYFKQYFKRPHLNRVDLKCQYTEVISFTQDVISKEVCVLVSCTGLKMKLLLEFVLLTNFSRYRIEIFA